MDDKCGRKRGVEVLNQSLNLIAANSGICVDVSLICDGIIKDFYSFVGSERSVCERTVTVRGEHDLSTAAQFARGN